MWAELVKIFSSGDDPLKVVADDFMEMLRTTHEMASTVRPHIFAHTLEAADHERIRSIDKKVDELETSIRKGISAHLSLSNSDVPFCLKLLLLGKEAERLGDYVKNVAKISTLGGTPVPEGALRSELEALVDIAMQLFNETPRVIADQNKKRATELLAIQSDAATRFDKLLVAVSESHHTAAEVTSLVLLTRYYKRIAGHLGNILTSVGRPVHEAVDH